jgi:hypothetical protein
MENQLTDDLDAYAQRVKGMRAEQCAALLRNHDALVASARWEALEQPVREALSARIAIVREHETAEA